MMRCKRWVWAIAVGAAMVACGEVPMESQPEVAHASGALEQGLRFGTGGVDFYFCAQELGLPPLACDACGDGEVNRPWEECDEGAGNRDDGACLGSCKVASCGDGHVQAGQEECDEGSANASDGSCWPDCRRPCAPGTYDTGTTCDACPAGSVQAQAGKTFCTACPPGSFDDGSEVCAACPAGSVQPSSGQLQCTACGPGTIDDGSEVCAACPSGSVQPSAAATGCEPCGAGSYDDGSESCAACPAGSVQPGSGQAQCVSCGPGTIDDGSEICAACPVGSVQPAAGQASCETCGPGSYDDGSEACAACPAGSVQPSAGATGCAPCGAGSYDDGSESCASCPPGRVQPDSGQTGCASCGPGTYDDGGESCASCPQGTVQPASEKSGCSACEAGSYDDGDEVCAVCPAGSFQTEPAQSGCAPCAGCEVGDYVAQACSAERDTVCAPCDPVANCSDVSCAQAGASTCFACDEDFVDDGAGGCEMARCGDSGVCPGGFECVDGVSCRSLVGDTVYIPAGDFWMGCHEALGDSCRSSERPQHLVTTSAYRIDRTEVTAGAYHACVLAGWCPLPVPTGQRQKTYQNGKDDHPINHVNFEQAATYCAWDGKPEGAQMLCTEAQWERAARGGCETVPSPCRDHMRTFPWGEAPFSCDYAVIRSAEGSACGTGETWPVGSIPAGDSPYGLSDMSGNVLEWVADWYGPNYYASSPGTDPTGPATGTMHIVRGGSYDNHPSFTRAAFRNALGPRAATILMGFRCCGSAP